MTRLVYALRETIAASARRGDINIAEGINALAQALSSILAGAYSSKKDRDIVLMALPDLIRAYFPQWEAIYKKIECREHPSLSTPQREG